MYRGRRVSSLSSRRCERIRQSLEPSSSSSPQPLMRTAPCQPTLARRRNSVSTTLAQIPPPQHSQAPTLHEAARAGCLRRQRYRCLSIHLYSLIHSSPRIDSGRYAGLNKPEATPPMGRWAARTPVDGRQNSDSGREPSRTCCSAALKKREARESLKGALTPRDR